MKREKMLKAMSLIDEEYVSEAHPERLMQRRSKLIKLCSLAACLCIMITALSLWMFIPFSTELPDVSEYEDSEYYSIIEKLNVATFRPPVYKNNFQKIFRRIINFIAPKTEDSLGLEGSSSSYREVTDNQVQGVIEADNIKRTDSHIFYLHENVLKVYAINGSATKCIEAYTVIDDELYSNYGSEMYLSEDGSILTVIIKRSKYFSDGFSGVGEFTVFSLDVTDPFNVVRRNRICMSGKYISSRMVDGELLLFSDFRVKANPDFSDSDQFIPQYDLENGSNYVTPEDIISPDVLSSSDYTVVWRFDEKTLELKEKKALLSYSDEYYVSDDTVYFSRQYGEEKLENGIRDINIMTEIVGIGYKDGLKYLGKVTVKGYLNDQYSFDEYNGILRVVTTVQNSRYKVDKKGETQMADVDTSSGFGVTTSASLYCIDLASWQVASSVENFAPIGEMVRSVRFDGAAGYVCTSVQSTDPVFFFDLTDVNNITYKDTGTIPGFSTSLIQLGNGYLLGIGRGADFGNVKIEVYEESESGVVSVCSKEYVDADYSDFYKSYLVDRENGLIGLGINYHSYGINSTKGDRYILLHFDGYDLIELCNVELQGYNADKRAVYIDGYLYMFAESGFKVQKIN